MVSMRNKKIVIKNTPSYLALQDTTFDTRLYMSVRAICVCPSASLMTCLVQKAVPGTTKDHSLQYVFSSIPWMYMYKAAVFCHFFPKGDLVCDFPFAG